MASSSTRQVSLAVLALRPTRVLLVLALAALDVSAQALQNSSKKVAYVDAGSSSVDHGAIGPGTVASAVHLLSTQGGGTVVLTGSQFRIRTSLTIPTNVQIAPSGGAFFDVANNALLDIQGPLQVGDATFLQGAGSVFLRSVSAIDPVWFGAVGDGVHDDTGALQRAIDAAAQFYNLGAYPPAGSAYPPPVVRLRPGCYRLLGELQVYSGLTIAGEAGTPFTNGHTRLVMDLPGNNSNILRITRSFQGAQRTASATVTLQDLEFWFVTIGGSMLQPAGGQGYGNNLAGQPTHRGCAVKIAEQVIDMRIKRCNFFQSPDAAIALETDPLAPSASLRNVIVDECEFDAGNRLIHADGVRIELTVHDSKFFSGSSQILAENCNGSVDITDSEFDHNARVTITDCSLDTLKFTGNHHKTSGPYGFLTLSRARVVNISGNTFGLATQSTLHVVDAEAGVISGNAIDDSGYNTSFTMPTTGAASDVAAAAIRMVGCRNVLVSGNSISTTDSALYGGFGIYTRDGQAGRASTGNFIHGNLVSGAYGGASWRGQDRKINIASGDSQTENRR